MRNICRLCSCKFSTGRSSHLKDEHGISTYKGSVREYFSTPEELGIPREFVNGLEENEHVIDSWRKSKEDGKKDAVKMINDAFNYAAKLIEDSATRKDADAIFESLRKDVYIGYLIAEHIWDHVVDWGKVKWEDV